MEAEDWDSDIWEEQLIAEATRLFSAYGHVQLENIQTHHYTDNGADRWEVSCGCAICGIGMNYKPSWPGEFITGDLNAPSGEFIASLRLNSHCTWPG